jgi:16S rRNA (guanine1516-N2)-methyltransferase
MRKEVLVWGGDDPALAATLALSLSLEVTDHWWDDPDQQYLYFRDGALSLGLSPQAREHPICVDFVDQWRSRHRGKELLLKAIGGRRDGLRVVDATAGLGRDSFLLAGYGAIVQMCERQPIVAAMLENGLQRGRDAADIADVLDKMSLVSVPAVDYLASLEGEACPDVVYLDPMFPDSGKSALVKKEMRLFHHLVGKDEDADALLDAALAKARHRVVVKRPPKAPVLGGRAPQFSVSGKAVRFDIYPLRAFGK